MQNLDAICSPENFYFKSPDVYPTMFRIFTDNDPATLTIPDLPCHFSTGALVQDCNCDGQLIPPSVDPFTQDSPVCDHVLLTEACSPW